jgi:hypothetical protein
MYAESKQEVQGRTNRILPFDMIRTAYKMGGGRKTDGRLASNERGGHTARPTRKPCKTKKLGRDTQTAR